MSNGALMWFLLGLGSQLQIVASLGVSELAIFLIAPLIFLSEHKYMKQSGMTTFFGVSLLVVIGCAISCVANRPESRFVLRGFAVVCLTPCIIIVVHRMLRKRMDGIKWFLVGYAISGVVSTFVFQKSVEVTMQAGGVSGIDAADMIMSGPIYWIQRLSPFITLYPQGWYISCPFTISWLSPLFVVALAIFTSISGRAVAIGSIATTVLILLGGKTPSQIRRRICKNFWFLVILAIAGINCISVGYRILAQNGTLGEEARVKYENQTKGSHSIGQLLLGGRMASFCGLLACVDKPIVGFGPWAMDRGGYTQKFLEKFATAEDYNNYLSMIQFFSRIGIRRESLIECHSYIVEFWCWYGIAGLIFWLYALFVLVRYLKEDCYAIPQWYMWLAGGIPMYIWDIFFSPFGNRVPRILMLVACLMVRAVRKGRVRMPNSMRAEILKLGYDAIP